MKRLAPVVIAALAVAGCGGSSHTSTSAAAASQEQIKNAYAKFFAHQTSLPDRVALLQNGPKFKSVIQGFASNPLAKNVKVTVSSVKLQGANDAKVVYTVRLGSAGLPKQTGTAVRQNGTWKIGYASLCRLVSLAGSTPSACKS